ncbi:hypothetical protein CAEBREN_32388 [Caenorhabditis brenneri]|uniref:Ribosome assembly factor mrt4 n=1 Tax=Caenorhabditis brenneri TaxID=135651 RepID=G0PL23_CAEBE|nr:hypothetical protein CAEBREN_32388 [Caenorhabditis brenneri]
MARSRRDKNVSLTKVKKKTKETKNNLVNEVRASVEQYKNLFIFTIANMRSTRFIAIRQKYKETSRFFFGKNNVIAIALGKQKSDEYANQLHKASELLKGQCGLMFTNMSKKEVLTEFAQISEEDYARVGDEATETVVLPEGPISQFAFSMEPQLRKLGLPTKLDKGVITLYQQFEVCKKGDKLTVEQAKILKHFEYKMAEFRLIFKGFWNKKDGFKELDA